MTDDLVTRLRVDNPACEEHFTANEAAARIEQQAATIARLEGERDALRNWRSEAGAEYRARQAAEAKVAALVEACEALREGYGASYIDAATWGAVTALADAAIAAAKGEE